MTTPKPLAVGPAVADVLRILGLCPIAARRDNHRIVGWQAVGAGVSELSTAFSHSLEMGATLEDVAGTIHAHPTLGEAVQEAALRAVGHALHI